MYLLDTNHCSRILNGDQAIIGNLESLGNAHVATSVIVRGELVYMAYKSERRTENLRLVMELIVNLDVLPVDNEVADIYGKLKAALIDHFGPKEKAQRRRAEIEKLGFKENDLWIAAVAKRNKLTIVSSDSDFQRIKEVDDIQVESWLAAPSI